MKKYVYLLPLVCLVSAVSSCSSSESSSLDINKVNLNIINNGNLGTVIYDEKDTVYYSKFGKISCNYVSEYLKNIDYNKLLDVGCGTGYLINLLQYKDNTLFYGLDLSEEMLKMAKSKNIRNAEFILGSADKLPFDDNSFDVVTCIQSFHHYPLTPSRCRTSKSSTARTT